jgi:hypothetical protein
MTDRKKVDIAIFECSEENEVENLRQVVICPPFPKGWEGRPASRPAAQKS